MYSKATKISVPSRVKTRQEPSYLNASPVKRRKTMTKQTDLARDLILVPVKHDGPGKVYQTNLLDILRDVTATSVGIDLLIGAKK